MKKYLLWLPLLLLLVACPAVKPDNPDNPDDPDNPVPEGSYFKLSSANGEDVPETLVYNCLGDGRHYSIKYDTNMDNWSAESDAAWCRIEKDVPSSGWIHFNLDSYADAHSEIYPRFCKVHIVAPGVLDRTFTVGQESENTFLYTLPNTKHSFTIPASGASVDLTVASNLVEWVIENGTDWIVAEKIDRTTLRVKVIPTETPQRRNGEITLASVANGASGHVSIIWKLNFTEEDPGASGDDYGYGNGINWD